MISNSRSNKRKNVTFNVEDIDLGKGHIIIGLADGVPSIHFSKHVHSLIDATMSKIMVIKLLGHRIGFDVLLNKI